MLRGKEYMKYDILINLGNKQEKQWQQNEGKARFQGTGYRSGQGGGGRGGDSKDLRWRCQTKFGGPDSFAIWTINKVFSISMSQILHGAYWNENLLVIHLKFKVTGAYFFHCCLFWAKSGHSPGASLIFRTFCFLSWVVGAGCSFCCFTSKTNKQTNVKASLSLFKILLGGSKAFAKTATAVGWPGVSGAGPPWPPGDGSHRLWLGFHAATVESCMVLPQKMKNGTASSTVGGNCHWPSIFVLVSGAQHSGRAYTLQSGRSGWGKSRLTVVSMTSVKHSLFSLLLINYCIIFHTNNSQSIFPHPLYFKIIVKSLFRFFLI